VRLGLGNATSQETESPATCEDRCELPHRADGG
jgi:hypothetical protein